MSFQHLPLCISPEIQDSLTCMSEGLPTTSGYSYIFHVIHAISMTLSASNLIGVIFLIISLIVIIKTLRIHL